MTSRKIKTKLTEDSFAESAACNILPKKNNYIIEYIVNLTGIETQKVYIKQGFLGRGGFANCFITQQMGSNRLMATKIIEKNSLKSSRTKLRLINEIKVHKTFSHPNIVEFIHYFEDYDNVYIMLQLCENQSLNQLIKQRGTLSYPQVQSFIYGICNGLKYLHQKKFIHRDLKLGNIFLNDKFQIKIGDFGLTSQLQFLKQNKRTVCGTPNYIAPQVLEGVGYYFQVDIWAVGIIMYTLLYGYPPFQSENTAQIYAKIKNCHYMFPKINGVPIQAINLIKSILVPKPEKRPSIDQILNSPFMKLGNGIPLELPQCCYIRAPTKSQIEAMPLLPMKDNIMKQSLKFKNNFLSHDFQLKKNKQEKSTLDKTMSRDCNTILQTDYQQKIKPIYRQNYRSTFSQKKNQKCNYKNKIQKKVQKLQQLPQHVIDFEVIDEKGFYFCTNKYVIGTYQKQREICFRHLSDFQKNQQEIHQIKLYNNLFSEQGQIPYSNYRYKALLNLKAKQIIANLRKKNYAYQKQLPQNKLSGLIHTQKLTYILRVNAYKDMAMVKLSNKMIQIIYHHTKDGFLFDIKNEKLYFYEDYSHTNINTNAKQLIIDHLKETVQNFVKNSQKCSKVPNIQTFISVANGNEYVKISMQKLKHIYGVLNEVQSKVTKHNRNRNSQ